MNNRATRTIDNAEVVFRNFAGLEKQYNDAGDRNFCIILSEDLANEMAAEGYNVKRLPATEHRPERLYVKVTVSFKGRPPRLVMIGSRGRVDLDEDTCEMLDFADIRRVDLIIRPYHWGPIRGATGVAAYVQSFFLFVDEDELELRYAHIPRIGEQGPAAIEAMPAYGLDGQIIEGTVVEQHEIEAGVWDR